MGLEIERKFLVKSDAWQRQGETRTQIVQAYIALGDKASVRVRIHDDENAVLTVKSREPGLIRAEFEYRIPVADARAMLPLRTGSLIEKTRTVVRHEGQVWEVDVFSGNLTGLVLAEVELHAAVGDVPLPQWIGREVTGDARYYNAALAVSGSVPQAQHDGASPDVHPRRGREK